jgi:hypothetical protein
MYPYHRSHSTAAHGRGMIQLRAERTRNSHTDHRPSSPFNLASGLAMEILAYHDTNHGPERGKRLMSLPGVPVGRPSLPPGKVLLSSSMDPTVARRLGVIAVHPGHCIRLSYLLRTILAHTHTHAIHSELGRKRQSVFTRQKTGSFA